MENRTACAALHTILWMSRLKLLFVDDEQLILNSLDRLFRRHPEYETTHTIDPFAVVDLVVQRGIDIVLIDYSMPRRNGIDVCADLHARSPTTARILMTGSVERDVAVRAINEGRVRHFIEKPWSNDALLVVVSSVADEIRSSRATAMPAPDLTAAAKTFGRKLP